VIRARALTKRYGLRTVVSGIDLDLGRGRTLLVTGANGSGKTTLLRLLSGLAAPSSGSLEVTLERRHLGYLAHESLLYRDLTAHENLELFARLYRVEGPRQRIDELLGRFGLAEAGTSRVSTFSRGMTQRLALCRTLLHRPELLILDEPHTALDAAGGELLDAELLALSGKATIVVSSHDPARIEPFCTDRLELVIR
jgi:ABC-type multidrug transport system ATPase subunit